MTEINSYEELLAELERRGVKAGGWHDMEARTVKPAFADRQAELLSKVKDLLEAQLEEDKKSLAQAQETLNRLRHGGGI